MIVAGFGFRGGASLASLRCALAGHGAVEITHLATAKDKLGALEPLAREIGLPVIGLDAEALRAARTATVSKHSQAARGTGSVAEAAALAGGGAGARLIHPRRISIDRMATCAIAQGHIL